MSLAIIAPSISAFSRSAATFAATSLAASARSRCFRWRSIKRALTSSGGTTMVFPEPVGSAEDRARFSAKIASKDFSPVIAGDAESVGVCTTTDSPAESAGADVRASPTSSNIETSLET